MNDVEIKTRKIREFLGEGHKVKITMRFRGRDLAHTNLGRGIFDTIITGLGDISKVENKTEFTGNTLMVLISCK